MSDEDRDGEVPDSLPSDLQTVLNEMLDSVEDELIEELETVQGEIDRARAERSTLSEELSEKREEAERYYGLANESVSEQETRRYAGLAQDANHEAQDIADKVEHLENRIRKLKQRREQLAKKMALAELADGEEE